jgi:hypothetical protein
MRKPARDSLPIGRGCHLWDYLIEIAEQSAMVPERWINPLRKAENANEERECSPNDGKLVHGNSVRFSGHFRCRLARPSYSSSKLPSRALRLLLE